jgi:hypothetical protein
MSAFPVELHTRPSGASCLQGTNLLFEREALPLLATRTRALSEQLQRLKLVLPPPPGQALLLGGPLRNRRREGLARGGLKPLTLKLNPNS